MRKLALLGITAGVLMANQPVIEASEEKSATGLEHMIAKPKCKAHGGCGGLTASRDQKTDEELDSEDEEINDTDEAEITTDSPEADKI